MTDRILIGRITAAHGIRGDVVVASFAAVPEDIGSYGPLADVAGTRTFNMKVLRVTPKGGVIARLDGVTDRNAAEALKGTELYVHRARLPAAGEGEFYHADLIGMTAVAPDGLEVGEVIAVENFGAGDLIEIRLAGSRATELVPFSDRYVPQVDVAGRRIVVVLPRSAADED